MIINYDDNCQTSNLATECGGSPASTSSTSPVSTTGSGKTGEKHLKTSVLTLHSFTWMNQLLPQLDRFLQIDPKNDLFLEPTLYRPYFGIVLLLLLLPPFLLILQIHLFLHHQSKADSFFFFSFISPPPCRFLLLLLDTDMVDMMVNWSIIGSDMPSALGLVSHCCPRCLLVRPRLMDRRMMGLTGKSDFLSFFSRTQKQKRQRWKVVQEDG